METLDPVAASRRPGAPALTAKNSLADATLAGAHPRWAVTMGAVVGRVVVVDLVRVRLRVRLRVRVRVRVTVRVRLRLRLRVRVSLVEVEREPGEG